jgi:hypothetical protein
VKIKSRNEILNDVIQDGKKHPKGWKAVFGKDPLRFSRDYYLFNPDIGVYLLKEYNKNPFLIKGLGGKIARRIDDDVEALITKQSGDFGIIQGDLRRVLKNIDKGMHPDEILDAAIKGKKDYGISMPIRGKASSSKNVFNDLRDMLVNRQKKLDYKLEKLASDDGIYDSYR